MQINRDLLPTHIKEPNPEIYFSRKFIVIDFETSNKDKGDVVNPDNRIVLTCYKQGHDDPIRYTWKNEYEIGYIIELCEQADFIVAHNAKFELQWLAKAGLDLTKIVVFDTMIAEYIIAGNRGWRLKLDEVAQRYGLGGKTKLVSQMIEDGICPSTIPVEWLLKYCIQDVNITHQLFKEQLEVLEDSGLLPVMYGRCLFTPVLADIEMNGLCLNEAKVLELYNDYVYKLSEVQTELDAMTGGINPRSPKQVGEFLYDVLKFPVPKVQGVEKRKTDKDTIARLKPKTKKQIKFLELKAKQSQLNAAITKTLKPSYDCIQQTEDNILHAGFNQCVARTHRLSSSGKLFGMQFQNFPRIFKCIFGVRHKDWKLRGNDYEQLEFIVGGFLTDDPQVLSDKLNGVDIHQCTAEVVFDEEIKKLPMPLKSTEEGSELRNKAKEYTFGPTFGKMKGETQKETDYYTFFREKYHVMTEGQQEWIEEVLETKQLVTLNGLIFYWPDTELKINRNGDEWVTNSNNIKNYPIQYFAASELANTGTLHLWHYLKALILKSFLVNTVHDSNLLEEHPDEHEIINEIVPQAMEQDVITYLDKLYGITYDYPLIVETNLGDVWK